MSRYNYVYSSGLSYKEYLQAQLFVDEITSATRESGRAVRMEISRQTREIIASREALEQENIRLRESLAEGFETLSYELQDISTGISELNARFHWGFSQVIAGIGRMNDALAELVRIAKTPAQTAAYEQYEIARDAFRRELYEDCLETVEKAISIYKLDWRFHQMKGTLCLGSVREQSLMNLAQAEESFLLAARYAKTDYRADAARAFLAAGWAAYCQGRMKEALAHTEQAIALNPKLGEAFFQAAKVCMALGEVDTALPVLRNAIDLDRDYIIKAAADGDFQEHDPTIREFYEALRQEKYRQALPQVQAILQKISFWLEHSAEAKNDLNVRTMQSFVTSGFSWPLLDILALVQSKIGAVQSKARDARVVVTQILLESSDRSIEIVVEPAGPFRTEKRITRRLDVIRDDVFTGLGDLIVSLEFVRYPAGRFYYDRSELILPDALSVTSLQNVLEEAQLAVVAMNVSAFYRYRCGSCGHGSIWSWTWERCPNCGKKDEGDTCMEIATKVPHLPEVFIYKMNSYMGKKIYRWPHSNERDLILGRLSYPGYESIIREAE